MYVSISPIFFYLERLFGKAWREEFVVLYEDSSVIWFRDRDKMDPEGGILLRDAPEMLAAGQVNNGQGNDANICVERRVLVWENPISLLHLYT